MTNPTGPDSPDSPDNPTTSEPKFTDTRPIYCRVRQYDEGKGYNKYRCLFCGATALNPFPCPHENSRPGLYREKPELNP